MDISPLASSATNVSTGVQAPTPQGGGVNPLELITQVFSQLGSIPMTQTGPQITSAPDFSSPKIPQVGADTKEYSTGSARKTSERSQFMAGVANAVGGAVQEHEAKKTRALEADATRLFTAYGAMQQAKQSGDQQAFKANQAIVNDIMSDPKKIKALAKGFNVSLFDDKNANSPERKAIIAAAQKMQKEQGLNQGASRFMAQFPQTQQPNPQMQQLMGIIELLKKGGITDLAKEQMHSATEIEKQSIATQGANQRNLITNETRKMVSDTLGQVHDLASQRSYRASIARTIQMGKDAQLRANAAVESAKIHVAAMERIHADAAKTKEAKKKISDFSAELKALNDDLTNMDLQKKSLNAQTSFLGMDLSKVGIKPKGWQEQQDALDAKIKTTQERRDAILGQMQGFNTTGDWTVKENTNGAGKSNPGSGTDDDNEQRVQQDLIDQSLQEFNNIFSGSDESDKPTE